MSGRLFDGSAITRHGRVLQLLEQDVQAAMSKRPVDRCYIAKSLNVFVSCLILHYKEQELAMVMAGDPNFLTHASDHGHIVETFVRINLYVKFDELPISSDVFREDLWEFLKRLVSDHAQVHDAALVRDLRRRHAVEVIAAGPRSAEPGEGLARAAC